jgi:tetraprenyl-beta-curcumene synthase
VPSGAKHPSALRDALGALVALTMANVRYWSTVAPIVRAELARWKLSAKSIPDPVLRDLALEKLTEEHFNAEVAATLATLSPARSRPATVRAIVALELLFDYLDGRTELSSEDPLESGKRLFRAFTWAVDVGPDGELGPSLLGFADRDYLTELGSAVRRELLALPAWQEVQDIVRSSAKRCAEAQIRLHAAISLGDQQLGEWAERAAQGSGLGWREYLGGSASSVLSVHALIAAAGDPLTRALDARQVDAAYLAIGGVITMLDSVVDLTSDEARGEAGFIRLFASEEAIEASLRGLTREALTRARKAPSRAHHAMTLAGVGAYYTTHPNAQEGHARPLSAMTRRELLPTIWPALAVMRAWRGAKSVNMKVAKVRRRMTMWRG